MRRILGVCLLVLLLTGSVAAGEMPNLSPAPPPSQPSVAEPGIMPNESPTSAVNEPTVNGEMPNGAPDSLTQLALELLAVLPSLL